MLALGTVGLEEGPAWLWDGACIRRVAESGDAGGRDDATDALEGELDEGFCGD